MTKLPKIGVYRNVHFRDIFLAKNTRIDDYRGHTVEESPIEVD